MYKVYEKTKNYIKNNSKSLLLLLIIILLFTIRLPYYISSPGGLLNTKNKIDMPYSFKLSGSLNMAYVSQIDGSVPMLIYALINPNWDIEKEEEVTQGIESIDAIEYRNKMLLKEANNTALLVAYNNSNINFKIENNKIYVTYVDPNAKTNLKIKDQIIKIDNQKIIKKQDLYDYIDKKQINDKVKITVLRNQKQKNCTATLIDVANQAKVGIVITEDFDIKSDNHVNFSFSDSESGSSGGLMMTLALYSYLNKIDITHGKKIAGTGTIDKDGNVGQISGIKYKLIGAAKSKCDIFLVPQGKNYQEAKKIKNKNNYDIDIIPVKTFAEALKYLK